MSIYSPDGRACFIDNSQNGSIKKLQQEIAVWGGQMDSRSAQHARGSWFVPQPRQSQLTPRIHYVQASSSASHDGSTLDLKPMGGVNPNPKQRVPVAAQSGDLSPQKI